MDLSFHWLKTLIFFFYFFDLFFRTDPRKQREPDGGDDWDGTCGLERPRESQDHDGPHPPGPLRRSGTASLYTLARQNLWTLWCCLKFAPIFTKVTIIDKYKPDSCRWKEAVGATTCLWGSMWLSALSLWWWRTVRIRWISHSKLGEKGKSSWKITQWLFLWDAVVWLHIVAWLLILRIFARLLHLLESSSTMQTIVLLTTQGYLLKKHIMAKKLNTRGMLGMCWSNKFVIHVTVHTYCCITSLVYLVKVVVKVALLITPWESYGRVLEFKTQIKSSKHAFGMTTATHIQQLH